MLSYMLPVEEKQPSATAAATRNLSLNLTTTSTNGSGGGGSVVGVSTIAASSKQLASSALDTSKNSSAAENASVLLSSSVPQGEIAGCAGSSSVVVARSIIKPTIKHSAIHRYQLIPGTVEINTTVGGSKKQQSPQDLHTITADSRLQQQRWNEDNDVSDLCDESTNLLAGDPGEANDNEDEKDDDGAGKHGTIDVRPLRQYRNRNVVQSDRNFNNLILVTNGNITKGSKASTNGGQSRKLQGNGNHAASVKLASVLKHTNSSCSSGGVVGGCGSGGGGGNSSGGAANSSFNSISISDNSGSGTGVVNVFYKGYIAVSGENDDEQHRLLVSAKNLRNSDDTLDQQNQHCSRDSKQPSTIGDYDVDNIELDTGSVTNIPTHHSTSTTATHSSRVMNSLNGNLILGRGECTEVMDLTEGVLGGGGGDTSIGSDSDSLTGAIAGETGGGSSKGGKKVKLNKLGGNKNVTLKRVSFGSSKGSMVETLVFETPTPLPEHAERDFLQSPAVLAGAGHTTLYSAGGGPGSAPHHHYPVSHLYQHPHHHHHVVQQHQYHQQQHLMSGYLPHDGGSGVGHDDSGIELQEEVERSKVRVTFFQSCKPQSISPPESLHLYGAQNLIQFGGTGLVGGYDNNNSPLDTYITSTALNQQYDALPGHQQQLQQYGEFHPDHRDPTMAAIYGTNTVPPASYSRQMSTEAGWDNPFRPGGDLSREADEIVNLIKGGKPITPTGDQSLINGSTIKNSNSTDNTGATLVERTATKLESSQLQASQQNGTKSSHKTTSSDGTDSSVIKNGTTTTIASGVPGTGASVTVNNNSSTTPISNQVIPGPQSASHVVIDEKKKKKCTCCVIQ